MEKDLNSAKEKRDNAEANAVTFEAELSTATEEYNAT